MAKVDATGRTKRKDDHHVRLYTWLTSSDAWRHCSGNAIKLLVFIASFDFGDNNGRINMSERRAAEGVHVDRKTVRKLFRELQEKGFLVCTSGGSFKAKRSPAAEWRLTWKAWPDRSQGPSNEYRRWRPSKKSRGEKFPISGGEIPHHQPEPSSDGGESPPLNGHESQKSAKPDLGIFPPLTLATGEGAGGSCSDYSLVPEVADDPNYGNLAGLDLRNKIARYFHKLSPKRQRSWAKAHGVTRDDVRQYLIGDSGHLPAPKVAAMVLAITNEKAALRQSRSAGGPVAAGQSA